MKIPDSLYNFFKWFLMLFVPALMTLVAALGTIYKVDTEVIVLTIGAFATFLGTITGISSYNYNKKEADYFKKQVDVDKIEKEEK